MRAVWRVVVALGALAGAVGQARAQQQADPAPALLQEPAPQVPREAPQQTPQPARQTSGTAPADLYLQAMQAISEGRTADADGYLADLNAQGPRHAGEWLDLALIHCALGHAGEAARLFTDIEQRFNPPRGILDLIEQRRAQGCARWQSASQLNVLLGRGIDRNVNQGASNPSYSLGGTGGITLELLPEYRPRRDQYTLLTADYLRELNPSGTTGFAQLLVRRNDSLADYSTAALFGGLEQPMRWGRWRMNASAFGGMLTLGGRLYQQQAQLQARVYPPLALPDGFELYGLAGLSHARYTTVTNFNANTTELRAVLAYHRDDRQLRLSGAYLRDHAIGTRPGGDRSGLALALNGRYRFASAWQGELDLSGQTWQGESAYALPLIVERRHQLTMVARGTLTHALDQHHAVLLELRHVRNRENISIFEYQDTVLQLSWQWSH